MNIGFVIKTFRRKHNITQKELASKINMSERMIQKYENDEIEPSLKMIDKLANALGVSSKAVLNIASLDGSKQGEFRFYIDTIYRLYKENPENKNLYNLIERLESTGDLDYQNIKSLIQNQGALSTSYLFPYDGDENSWIMQNLTPEQKEEYIRNSEIYLKNKEKINIEETKLDILAAYVEIIAEDFIEVDKDKIEEFSKQVASFINEYVEALVKARIKGMIAKNTLNAKK